MENLRYGDGPRAVLDLFKPDTDDAPLVVFFHGGYWRAGDKQEMSFMAKPLLAAGIALALPNYDLCPAVTLPQIVHQAREAVAFAIARAPDWQVDPRRIVVAGLSAGAHLAAACLTADLEGPAMDARAIKGALLISGVYRPAVVLDLALNAEIQLTPETAAAADVYSRPLAVHCPVVVAVGGDEPAPWIELSREYAAKLTEEKASPVHCQVLPHHNHFSIIEELEHDTSTMTRLLLDLCK